MRATAIVTDASSASALQRVPAQVSTLETKSFASIAAHQFLNTFIRFWNLGVGTFSLSYDASYLYTIALQIPSPLDVSLPAQIQLPRPQQRWIVDFERILRVRCKGRSGTTTHDRKVSED